MSEVWKDIIQKYTEDGPIDLDRLALIKKKLIELVWQNPDSPVWDVVRVMDELQDAAVDMGLWEFPDSSRPISPSVLSSINLSRDDISWDMNADQPYKWDGVGWVPITHREYVERLSRK